MALDEAGNAWATANRPVFPFELPRWSCNLRQWAHNRQQFLFKMEIPGEESYAS
jgi:hypothetical protein